MGKEYLGEFEELVLLIIAAQGEESYGMAIIDEIKSHTGRSTTIGAVHATVARLEDKGFVTTYLGGASSIRGGRKKRLIQITSKGRQTLKMQQELKLNLWKNIPELTLFKS